MENKKKSFIILILDNFQGKKNFVELVEIFIFGLFLPVRLFRRINIRFNSLVAVEAEHKPEINVDLKILIYEAVLPITSKERIKIHKITAKQYSEIKKTFKNFLWTLSKGLKKTLNGLKWIKDLREGFLCS